MSFRVQSGGRIRGLLGVSIPTTLRLAETLKKGAETNGQTGAAHYWFLTPFLSNTHASHWYANIKWIGGTYLDTVPQTQLILSE